MCQPVQEIFERRGWRLELARGEAGKLVEVINKLFTNLVILKMYMFSSSMEKDVGLSSEFSFKLDNDMIYFLFKYMVSNKTYNFFTNLGRDSINS